MTGQVIVYNAQGRITKKVRDLWPDAMPTQVVTEPWQLAPDPAIAPIADYYLTTAGLNARIERAAARLSATPVVMPEGTDWLHARINAALARGDTVRIFLPSSGDELK